MIPQGTKRVSALESLRGSFSRWMLRKEFMFPHTTSLEESFVQSFDPKMPGIKINGLSSSPNAIVPYINIERLKIAKHRHLPMCMILKIHLTAIIEHPDQQKNK
jgi:hypothetical protein